MTGSFARVCQVTEVDVRLAGAAIDMRTAERSRRRRASWRAYRRGLAGEDELCLPTADPVLTMIFRQQIDVLPSVPRSRRIHATHPGRVGIGRRSVVNDQPALQQHHGQRRDCERCLRPLAEWRADRTRRADLPLDAVATFG